MCGLNTLCLQENNEKLSAEMASLRHNMQLVMKQMRSLTGGNSLKAAAPGSSETGSSANGPAAKVCSWYVKALSG